MSEHKDNSLVTKEWISDLKQVVTSPEELLSLLNIPVTPQLKEGFLAKKLFNLRVPRPFIDRMEKENLNDPLLKQVLTHQDEFIQAPEFTNDPLEEQENSIPGLLHKYTSRVLLVLKGSCAINCRYCFRRHFPYESNAGNKKNWQNAIDYIQNDHAIDEVILSGGDPLMAKDEEIAWIFEQIETIQHIKTIRIHTRLAVVIPNRISEKLLDIFYASTKNIVLVTHINHPNEIDDKVIAKMNLLRSAKVTLLNQSVLLKDINDNEKTLISLSHKLFDAGILPYYLHLLDKVEGAVHFYVDDNKAKLLMQKVQAAISGYLVPKLTREIPGKPSKTPIDFMSL
ncbi:EF-P beta-lysylation protein EpmB [Thorsellia kenyensis]|uniref:L-lysine 2,3-aminomutase n=1 Tax=Thorsellia kenyensis TaxID=1549888 RepID=A0ABV6CDJ7_9GAMM